MRKRKTSLGRAILIILILLSVSTFLIYKFSYWLNRPRFVRYPAFGIDMPVNYIIHGVDVSHHQSNIDWEEVKKMKVDNISIHFCFIKATEGIESIDTKFRKNWFEAEKNHITKGAYHYFNPGRDGFAQAENFIETVKLSKGDLPPVLDIEDVHGVQIEKIQQRVQDWLTTVEAYYHVKPIIYTNVDFYERNLAGKFDEYPLWAAHYLIKDEPRIKRDWKFWQHNTSGRVNGIGAYVDFNVFNGNIFEFENMLIK